MRNILIIVTAVLIANSRVLAANEITLKTSIVVDGQYITLGDFFGIYGDKALKRVAYSPKPGQSSLFDTRWLYRLAYTHKLNWRPINNKTQVTVQRSSQEIYPDEIQTKLISAIRKKGVDDEFEITINGRLRSLHVAVDKPATIGIGNILYDNNTGRFAASLIAPANDPNGQRLRVTGRTHKLMTIPVISKELRRGAIIKKDNIEWLKIRSSRVRKGTILDETELLGMAVKRTIRHSTPIKSSHVRKPILVEKGNLVTIHLSTPMMRLTAQGKSLNEASLGEFVQVRNIQSKQVIEAKVAGLNEVEVSSAIFGRMN